jgi:nitrate reductase NapD
MNICSLVVHVKPEVAPAVQARLEDLPGVEVHGGADLGKLVVTVEDSPDVQAADTITAIGGVQGVLSTVLIYHYGGDEPLDEEVNGESH